jgi:hypothetical protein
VHHLVFAAHFYGWRGRARPVGVHAGARIYDIVFALVLIWA